VALALLSAIEMQALCEPLHPPPRRASISKGRVIIFAPAPAIPTYHRHRGQASARCENRGAEVILKASHTVDWGLRSGSGARAGAKRFRAAHLYRGAAEKSQGHGLDRHFDVHG